MIGFRGASRYYDDRYREGFALECRALKTRARRDGADQRQGDGALLPDRRGSAPGHCASSRATGYAARTGLELYMMVEIPSNVILLPDFAEYFDGFSIGSNDLTQLTLGVDRDSEIVAHVFDERNTAVRTLVAQAIRTRAAARPEDRPVRPGAERLSGLRQVPRRLRDRQHVAQPRCRASDDAARCRGRGLSFALHSAGAARLA